MIFKTITLHNLFCYCGTHTFDLTPPSDDNANIVVIMGRNGFGKTSFLNSIKLLFGGVTKELRQAVQRDKAPQEKGFVLGDRDWWGVLNHQAKMAGDLECHVSAVLLDEQNREIEIKRCWNLAGDNYKNQLFVIAPRKPQLTDDAAQQYLSGLLPLDYIPFFFFDAEEIGYLAEANRNQVIEKMEQLLNIRPVDNLKECIKEVTRKVEHKFIAKDAELELVKAENRLQEKSLQQEQLHGQQKNIESDIETLEDELREIRHKIQLLSGQGTVENNARLETEKNAELKKQEEALTKFSELFEYDAFLRLNSKLVDKTLPFVESCSNTQQGTMTEMLDSLREPLKEIFTSPPYPNDRLSESQVSFYQRRISKLLDSRDVDEEQRHLFQIESKRAKKLLHLLTAYAPTHTPEKVLSDDLMTALKADKAVYEIDKSLQDISQLSEESKQQLLELQELEGQKKEERDKRNDDKREIQHQLSVIEREIKPLTGNIAELRKQARKSEQGSERIELLDRMQKILADYKQQLKERQREKLETYLNQHLASLLDSNHLIASIEIDNFFQLHYRDADGNAVAMSSISAGMKQLAATALLWALKDACGKLLPIVIDTPLGRIDKQHQENLLSQYYPHAARQIILLPTDSELTEQKYTLLEPYIYRRYLLFNEGGEKTEIREVNSNEELSYG